MHPVVLDPEGRVVLRHLPGLVAAGPAVLVTVFEVNGSTPRRVGARMVCRDGRLLAGTVGGGHLELRAIELAKTVQESGKDHLKRYPLGPELAQCCGGVMTLLFEPMNAARADVICAALDAAERGGPPLQTRHGDKVLAELPGSPATAVIFGAGHVGAALANVLSSLPWRVVVIDSRPEWADPARFPATTDVLCEPPTDVLLRWGWLGLDATNASDAPVAKKRCFTVVMTHDHGLDRELIDALLRIDQRCGGGDLAYVGVIGSKTKIATMTRRLRERGLPDETLQRLVAPIGLRVDGRMVGGKLPGEIAISVAAQLIDLAKNEDIAT